MNQKKKTGWKRYAAMFMAVMFVLGSIVGIGSLNAEAAVGETIQSLKVMQAGKNVMKKTIKMKAGNSKKLVVKANTVLSKKNITFRSSNKQVVTVNNNGKLTAKKSGSARITIMISKKGFKTKKTWVKISVTNSAEEPSEADQSPEPGMPEDSSEVSDNVSDNTSLPTQTPGADVSDITTPSDTIETPEPDTMKEPDTSMMPDSSEPNSGNHTGNILVAYFSWSGTSERIAQNIIAQTGADSFRIERETPYSDDYNTVAYGEAKEEADNNARPPIKNPLDSVAIYDKIVLCYPIWWHTAPMTVGTFLESYDMTGKTIYPISQSASMSTSQYEESVAFIKTCAKDAVVEDGLFTKDNDAIQSYIENTVLGS